MLKTSSPTPVLFTSTKVNTTSSNSDVIAATITTTTTTTTSNTTTTFLSGDNTGGEKLCMVCACPCASGSGGVACGTKDNTTHASPPLQCPLLCNSVKDPLDDCRKLLFGNGGKNVTENGGTPSHFESLKLINADFTFLRFIEKMNKMITHSTLNSATTNTSDTNINTQDGGSGGGAQELYSWFKIQSTQRALRQSLRQLFAIHSYLKAMGLAHSFSKQQQQPKMTTNDNGNKDDDSYASQEGKEGEDSLVSFVTDRIKREFSKISKEYGVRSLTDLKELHGTALRRVTYRLLQFYNAFVPMLNHGTPLVEKWLSEKVLSSKILNYGSILIMDLKEMLSSTTTDEDGLESESNQKIIQAFTSAVNTIEDYFKNLLSAPTPSACRNMDLGTTFYDPPAFIPFNPTTTEAPSTTSSTQHAQVVLKKYCVDVAKVKESEDLLSRGSRQDVGGDAESSTVMTQDWFRDYTEKTEILKMDRLVRDSRILSNLASLCVDVCVAAENILIDAQVLYTHSSDTVSSSSSSSVVSGLSTSATQTTVNYSRMYDGKMVWWNEVYLGQKHLKKFYSRSNNLDLLMEDTYSSFHAAGLFLEQLILPNAKTLESHFTQYLDEAKLGTLKTESLNSVDSNSMATTNGDSVGKELEDIQDSVDEQVVVVVANNNVTTTPEVPDPTKMTLIASTSNAVPGGVNGTPKIQEIGGEEIARPSIHSLNRLTTLSLVKSLKVMTDKGVCDKIFAHKRLVSKRGYVSSATDNTQKINEGFEKRVRSALKHCKVIRNYFFTPDGNIQKPSLDDVVRSSVYLQLNLKLLAYHYRFVAFLKYCPTSGGPLLYNVYPKVRYLDKEVPCGCVCHGDSGCGVAGGTVSNRRPKQEVCSYYYEQNGVFSYKTPDLDVLLQESVKGCKSHVSSMTNILIQSLSLECQLASNPFTSVPLLTTTTMDGDDDEKTNSPGVSPSIETKKKTTSTRDEQQQKLPSIDSKILREQKEYLLMWLKINDDVREIAKTCFMFCCSFSAMIYGFYIKSLCAKGTSGEKSCSWDLPSSSGMYVSSPTTLDYFNPAYTSKLTEAQLQERTVFDDILKLVSSPPPGLVSQPSSLVSNDVLDVLRTIQKAEFPGVVNVTTENLNALFDLKIVVRSGKVESIQRRLHYLQPVLDSVGLFLNYWDTTVKFIEILQKTKISKQLSKETFALSEKHYNYNSNNGRSNSSPLVYISLSEFPSSSEVKKRLQELANYKWYEQQQQQQPNSKEMRDRLHIYSTYSVIALTTAWLYIEKRNALDDSFEKVLKALKQRDPRDRVVVLPLTTMKSPEEPDGSVGENPNATSSIVVSEDNNDDKRDNNDDDDDNVEGETATTMSVKSAFWSNTTRMEREIKLAYSKGKQAGYDVGYKEGYEAGMLVTAGCSSVSKKSSVLIEQNPNPVQHHNQQQTQPSSPQQPQERPLVDDKDDDEEEDDEENGTTSAFIMGRHGDKKNAVERRKEKAKKTTHPEAPMITVLLSKLYIKNPTERSSYILESYRENPELREVWRLASRLCFSQYPSIATEMERRMTKIDEKDKLLDPKRVINESDKSSGSSLSEELSEEGMGDNPTKIAVKQKRKRSHKRYGSQHKAFYVVDKLSRRLLDLSDAEKRKLVEDLKSRIEKEKEGRRQEQFKENKIPTTPRPSSPPPPQKSTATQPQPPPPPYSSSSSTSTPLNTTTNTNSSGGVIQNQLQHTGGKTLSQIVERKLGLDTIAYPPGKNLLIDLVFKNPKFILGDPKCQLSLQPSYIEGAGQGVFLKSPPSSPSSSSSSIMIKKNEMLTFYDGVVTHYMHPKLMPDSIRSHCRSLLGMRLVICGNVFSTDKQNGDRLKFIDSSSNSSDLIGHAVGSFLNAPMVKNNFTDISGVFKTLPSGRQQDLRVANCTFVPLRSEEAYKKAWSSYISDVENLRLLRKLGKTVCVAIVASRDIEPGEELLIDYGADYWSVERQGGNNTVKKVEERRLLVERFLNTELRQRLVLNTRWWSFEGEEEEEEEETSVVLQNSHNKNESYHNADIISGKGVKQLKEKLSTLNRRVVGVMTKKTYPMTTMEPRLLAVVKNYFEKTEDLEQYLRLRNQLADYIEKVLKKEYPQPNKWPDEKRKIVIKFTHNESDGDDDDYDDDEDGSGDSDDDIASVKNSKSAQRYREIFFSDVVTKLDKALSVIYEELVILGKRQEKLSFQKDVLNQLVFGLILQVRATRRGRDGRNEVVKSPLQVSFFAENLMIHKKSDLVAVAKGEYNESLFIASGKRIRETTKTKQTLHQGICFGKTCQIPRSISLSTISELTPNADYKRILLLSRAKQMKDNVSKSYVVDEDLDVSTPKTRKIVWPSALISKEDQIIYPIGATVAKVSTVALPPPSANGHVKKYTEKVVLPFIVGEKNKDTDSEVSLLTAARHDVITLAVDELLLPTTSFSTQQQTKEEKKPNPAATTTTTTTPKLFFSIVLLAPGFEAYSSERFGLDFVYPM